MRKWHRSNSDNINKFRVCQPEHEQHPEGGKDCNYQRRTGSVDSREEELKATEAVSFSHTTFTWSTVNRKRGETSSTNSTVTNYFLSSGHLIIVWLGFCFRDNNIYIPGVSEQSLNSTQGEEELQLREKLEVLSSSDYLYQDLEKLVMDYIEPILSIASEIYTLVEKVKANRERCQRLSCRVKALEKVIKETGKRQPSGEVEQALRELHITLESAKNFIEKFTSANLMKRIVNSGNHEGEFDIFNERLSDAVQILSVFLQVEQQNVLDQVFDQTTRQKEDAVDGRKDNEELKKLLHDYMKAQEEKYEQLRIDVEKRMASLNKPSITEITTRMIKSDELKYDHPKKPFMTTPSSEVYRGEYNGFPVAIKRYTDLLNTSLRDVKSIFNKEVETMKRFESPNILRMFGICVKDEEGPSPQFLIIMEYCEKGSLRQVLDSDCKLSWTRKACMCLDAAKGLYRLHQTEEKSKVHGCINSSKFLVDKGYTVKLGGFELSKTETSLKKSIKTSTHREEGHCYYTPQKLNNINHKYSKECEIYSFGIVLWEIATRKKPFDGLTIQDVYQKVYTEKYQEPLPDDCPEPLGSLINDCRAYDSFQRPNAGVLVDKLGIVVAQLEE
ncbi:Mixed lineage kinase domain-like protein [Larimichthys crocea]|uniref:Uncharacterized protein n=1 Tax=Larimichthys crocea TaxID=215358 RepID=A0ACD3QD92_LARCR|nr:Mixed lineage kinase domain-like protein [Larimichthys crocea]